MSELTTAKEIYSQIGQKAFFMLGAQNFAGDDTSLTFKIRGSKKVSHIKIELTAMDLYNITFYKCGKESKVIAEERGFYSDMLHKAIEKNTGLYTSL